MRTEWALHLEPLEVMRIGWALDFNNFNWWELGEHWTLTIWTAENWVSIGLWQFERVRIGWALDEPFKVVRTEWIMDFQVQYIGDVVISDWGLQVTQSKWSRLQREVLKTNVAVGLLTNSLANITESIIFIRFISSYEIWVVCCATW